MEKLRRWGIAGHKAETIVQHLVDTRFIDDSRYARAFVSDKYRYARWGRIKIIQALRLKRIDRDLIDEALAEEIDDETYIANLCALLRAKCRTIGMAETEPDHIARQKLIRFAAGRGYEPSLIMELVRDPDYWMDSDGTDLRTAQCHLSRSL